MLHKFRPLLDDVFSDPDGFLEQMNSKRIVAVGVAPYSRMVPSFFLKNYNVFTVRDSTDVDILEKYGNLYCLATNNPEEAERVRSTTYLLTRRSFTKYLNRFREPYALSFNLTNPGLVNKLEEMGTEWLGNRTETYDDVNVKKDFRGLLKKMELPHLEDWYLSRDEFLGLGFDEIFAKWGRAAVAQRADENARSGQEGTFFLHTVDDLKHAQSVLGAEEGFEQMQMSPFVKGASCSMLGCVTDAGTLSSTLQLELVDVPEALAGSKPASGAWLGHDWGATPWSESVEKDAQRVVEAIGKHLYEKGYRGVFGIDFVWDKAGDELFPVECNPRYTGALPMFPYISMQYQKAPPMDLFHLMAQRGIQADFDFDAVNAKYKEHHPVSHISLHPLGIYEMKLPITAGTYDYAAESGLLTLRRDKVFLWDIKDAEREFTLVNMIPRMGSPVQQEVQRLCSVIFPRSISDGSFAVTEEAGQIITMLSKALRKDQVAPSEER